MIVKFKYNYLILTYILYFCLLVLFSKNAPKVSLCTLGFVIFISLLFVVKISMLQALSLIPLVLLLGPILKIIVPAFGIITFGDIYILLLSIIFFFRWLEGNFELGPARVYVAPFISIFFISSLLSYDVRIAIPGIANMVQVILIYFFIINVVKRRSEAVFIIYSFAFAVIICILLYFYFHSKGDNMLLTVDLSTGEELSRLKVDNNSNIYIKSTFFYGHFTGIALTTAIIGYCNLILRNNKLLSIKIFFWSIVFILSTSFIIICGQRTVLIGLLSIMVAITVLRSFRYGFMKQLLINFIILILLGICFFINNEFNIIRLEVFWYSFIEGSESFNLRVIMWIDLLERILLLPKELLLGIGPGVNMRGLDNIAVQNIIYVKNLNSFVCSFHNGYFDLLLQHGILLLLLTMWVIFITMIKLFHKIIYVDDELSFIIFFVIMGWLIFWITMGWTWQKVDLTPAIFIAIGHLIISWRCNTLPYHQYNETVAKRIENTTLKLYQKGSRNCFPCGNIKEINFPRLI